jgi:hypothetical protein
MSIFSDRRALVARVENCAKRELLRYNVGNGDRSPARAAELPRPVLLFSEKQTPSRTLR